MTEDQMIAIADAVARLSIAVGDAMPRAKLEAIRVNGVSYTVHLSASIRAQSESAATNGLDGIGGSADYEVVLRKE